MAPERRILISGIVVIVLLGLGVGIPVALSSGQGAWVFFLMMMASSALVTWHEWAKRRRISGR